MSTDERRSDAGITGPRHAFEDEPQPQEPEYEGEGEKDDGELPGDYDDSIGPFPQEPAPGSPEAVKAAAETLQRWCTRRPLPGFRRKSLDEALAEIAALKEELERQSTAAGTLSDLIEKRTEERDALADACEGLLSESTSSYCEHCQHHAPKHMGGPRDGIPSGPITHGEDCPRASAEAALRACGRLAPSAPPPESGS